MKKIVVFVKIDNTTQYVDNLFFDIYNAMKEKGYFFEVFFFKRNVSGNYFSYLNSLLNSFPVRTPYELINISNGENIPDVMNSIIQQRKNDYFIVIDSKYVTAGKALNDMTSALINQEGILSSTSPGTIILRRDVLNHLLFLKIYDEDNYIWNLVQYAKQLGYHFQNAEGSYKENKKNSYFLLKLRKLAIGFYKFNPFCIRPNNPPSMRWAGIHHEKRRFVTHTLLHYKNSAVITLVESQKFILLLISGAILITALVNWYKTLIILFAIVICLYFLDLVFNFILIIRSFIKQPEIKVTEDEINSMENKMLPTITVLCPLYKESNILTQFITAVSQLDYPKDKLQILLLLEDDDYETITATKTTPLPPFIQALLTPYSLPRTKAKALNWGLTHSTGDIIVTYDAEDIPEKDQLKKAVVAFNKSDDKIVCLQAKLNFYNSGQNILTKLFTAEYSAWFDLILTGLYSINAPIPLGGTSNFFKRKALEELYAWDTFNVCEDCDMGLRLFKNGFKTAMFNSTTYEEANSDFYNWIRQRSHWIKGYIQSFFVHIRSPGEFIKSAFEPHLITFMLIVGGKTLSVFINPLLWAITLSYFIFRPYIGHFIESLYPPAIFYIGIFTLMFGNFLYLYNYILGCAERKHFRLVKYSYLAPIYWLAMSFAAWKALYQLILKPYYWEKTNHGLHLLRKNPTPPIK